MKKFIAFHGSSNSGIQTKEKALDWAKEFIGNGKISKVHIAEVTETVERTAPAVEVKTFFVALEGDGTAQAA